VKAERGPDEFSITLKNNSPKTVTAISISPSKGFTIAEELIFAETLTAGIEPNAVFSRRYADSTSEPIEIQAVLFDDGTAEGDPRVVRQMEDSRLGQQIQILRAVKELRNFLTKDRGDVAEFKRTLTDALNSSDEATLKIVAELRPSPAALTEKLSEGLINGRQIILRRLSEAESAGSNDSLIRMKDNYERILKRFRN
jgi:hypothetical protein